MFAFSSQQTWLMMIFLLLKSQPAVSLAIKKIHVFNSLATSGLETIMAYKIKELADNGTAFDELVKTVEDFVILLIKSS